MDFLTKEEENFCQLSGIFGIILSAGCFLQLIIVMEDNWLAYVVLGIYLLSIVSFVFLGRKLADAPVLILSGAIAILLAQIIMIFTLTISVLLSVLLYYQVLIAALLYTCRIPGQLKLKAQAQKADEQEWDGVI